MAKTKIILTPNKSILDNFFETDTSNFVFNFTQPDFSEIVVMSSLITCYHPDTVVHIPEVRVPIKTKTPDFLINNTSYEIKTPTSMNGVCGLFRKAKTQTKCDGYIVFELMNMRNAPPLRTCVKQIMNICTRRKKKHIIITCHGNILFMTKPSPCPLLSKSLA